MNKIISIGYTGIKQCYLNITMEEAIKRYCEQENMNIESFDELDVSVEEIEFKDEFGAYSIWE